MFRKLTLTLTWVFTILLFSALTIGQDKPKDMLYLVHKDVVIPNMVPQYEETMALLLEQIKTHNFGGEIRFASSTDDNEYFYLTPLESYADLDKGEGYWSDLIEKAGEETISAIFNGFEGCYDHHNNFVIKRSTNLSYMPENPRLKQEEIGFIHWDYYYFQDGKEEEAMKLNGKYKELWAKHNIGDSYSIWLSDIGHDLGMMVVTQGAKDAADYYTTWEATKEKLGEELEVLNAQFLPLMKDFYHKNGRPRPEYSYKPGE
jgi:hypothetical protein